MTPPLCAEKCPRCGRLARSAGMTLDRDAPQAPTNPEPVYVCASCATRSRS